MPGAIPRHWSSATFTHRFGLGLHHHGVHLLVLALVVVIVVVAVVALVRGLEGTGKKRTGGAGPVGTPPSASSPLDPALGELRVRYARGEISWEEYAHRAANLGYPAPPYPGAGPTPPPNPQGPTPPP